MIKANQRKAVREFLMLPTEFLEVFPMTAYGKSLYALAWPEGAGPIVLTITELRDSILRGTIRMLLVGRQKMDPRLDVEYQVHADKHGLVPIDPPVLSGGQLFSGGISARFDSLDPLTGQLEDRPDTREFFNYLWQPIAQVLSKERVCWSDGKRASGVGASHSAIELYHQGVEWRRGIQQTEKYILCSPKLRDS